MNYQTFYRSCAPWTTYAWALLTVRVSRPWSFMSWFAYVQSREKIYDWSGLNRSIEEKWLTARISGTAALPTYHRIAPFCHLSSFHLEIAGFCLLWVWTETIRITEIPPPWSHLSAWKNIRGAFWTRNRSFLRSLQGSGGRKMIHYVGTPKLGGRYHMRM